MQLVKLQTLSELYTGFY